MKLTKKINTESFSRYEFKYLLPLKKAVQIEKEIKNFMFLDKNASKNKNKNYFVRSLYFDNEINSNFYEKVDGMETRKKFRIRVYSANERSKSPIFLEMKGRRNQRTTPPQHQAATHLGKLSHSQRDTTSSLTSERSKVYCCTTLRSNNSERSRLCHNPRIHADSTHQRVPSSNYIKISRGTFLKNMS